MFYLGKENKGLSISLVILQFTCLSLIFLTGPIFPDTIFLLLLYFTGIILGIWSLWSMKSDTLNIPPGVKPTARLTTNGPYKIIRHPMYLALLFVTIPLIVEKYNILRIIAETTLILDLLFKIKFEEKMLSDKLKGYDEYKKKTWKLIPLIY